MKKTGDSVATSKQEGLAEALRLVFAPAVWALHFFAIYLAHTFLCTFRQVGATGGGRLFEAAIAVLTAIAVFTIGVFVWRGRAANTADVWRQATLVLALLAVFATIMSGTAILFVSACGG